MKKLTFLHTSPVHIDTFDGLLQKQLSVEQKASIEVEHLVSEEFLDRARADGVTPELQHDIEMQIRGAVANGADVLLCTCSSIGGCAEAVDVGGGRSIMRVDRAMAEKAVAIGPRITVAATLASTVAPTIELLNDAAQKAQATVNLRPIVFESAWACFEAGDQAGYIREIANGLPAAASDADVIVLAQGSMAQAAEQCGDLGIPVLSSPKLGLEAALSRLQTSSQ